jgi:hypothetical protein
MRPIWFKALLLLAAVWLVAGGMMWWAKASRPTPEKLLAYVEKNPIAGKAPATRGEIVKEVAGQLNRLSFDERQELRLGQKLDLFFRELTPAEQSRFLDLTLPEGFKQMFDALNKMEPEKRKKFVERALRDMKEQEGMEIPAEVRERFASDGNVQKIVNQGLKSFYNEASAETKMDVAPLIEQMHRNLQGLR